MSSSSPSGRRWARGRIPRGLIAGPAGVPVVRPSEPSQNPHPQPLSRWRGEKKAERIRAHPGFLPRRALLSPRP